MLGADRGAGASSGMVLKNIAVKMYARGLLGAAPSYATVSEKDQKDIKNYPTLYASMGDHAYNNINHRLNIKKSHRFARPKAVDKGVPNVVGLNIREAIKLLEDAGLVVNFTGSGMVTSQSLSAGSQFARGQRIYLRLRNS
jgi:cell division protein FtsI (penicillin-binding protein 3)